MYIIYKKTHIKELQSGLRHHYLTKLAYNIFKDETRNKLRKESKSN